ncbi:hypothetical protein HDU86_004735 [Geranomyces michiganensis]|nr:hypothetical protein HDU86_004735 [Geranomyces michiganensis]
MFHLATCTLPEAAQEFHLLLHLIPTLFALKAVMDIRLRQIDARDDDDEIFYSSAFNTPEYDLGLLDMTAESRFQRRNPKLRLEFRTRFQ